MRVVIDKSSNVVAKSRPEFSTIRLIYHESEKLIDFFGNVGGLQFINNFGKIKGVLQ